MTSESDAARLIAAKRKTKQGVCPRCGATFTGLARKVYCSKICGVAAWQAANRERVNASRARKAQNPET